MVKLRLARLGAKKEARFRLVAIDSRSKRDGQALENLGYLNPITNPPVIKLKEDRIRDWLDKGAQPTESAASLIRKVGIEIPK